MTDCQSLQEPEAPQRRKAALALQPSARAFLLRTRVGRSVNFRAYEGKGGSSSHSGIRQNALYEV